MQMRQWRFKGEILSGRRDGKAARFQGERYLNGGFSLSTGELMMFDYGDGVDTSVVGLPIGRQYSDEVNRDHIRALLDHLYFFLNVEPGKYADSIMANRDAAIQQIKVVNDCMEKPVPGEALDGFLRDYLQWGLDPDIMDLSIQLGQAIVDEDYKEARGLHDQLESLKWYRSIYKEHLLSELRSPCQN